MTTTTTKIRQAILLINLEEDLLLLLLVLMIILLGGSAAANAAAVIVFTMYSLLPSVCDDIDILDETLGIVTALFDPVASREWRASLSVCLWPCS